MMKYSFFKYHPLEWRSFNIFLKKFFRTQDRNYTRRPTASLKALVGGKRYFFISWCWAEHKENDIHVTVVQMEFTRLKGVSVLIFSNSYFFIIFYAKYFQVIRQTDYMRRLLDQCW